MVAWWVKETQLSSTYLSISSSMVGWQVILISIYFLSPCNFNMFLAMKRAAVFGIVESLYVDPTLLDVTMLDGGKLCKEEFVWVKNPRNEALAPEPDHFFTVVAFNTSAYANERVLAGLGERSELCKYVNMTMCILIEVSIDGVSLAAVVHSCRNEIFICSRTKLQVGFLMNQ